ncbi:MAG: ATP-binding protein [Vicinamibacterales bacterium]
MRHRLLVVGVESETDVVKARQRARQIAAALSFDTLGQTKIATAVSELARNAYEHGGGGSVEFSVAGSHVPQLLVVTVADHGAGIANLDAVLSGACESETGLGIGLRGARRLMDQFDIASGPTGTVVIAGKLLPVRAGLVGALQVAEVGRALTGATGLDPLAELQQRNRELLRTLDLLHTKQDDLERVNRELEDTNRGVVALYAELDERADHLRRIDEVKTRFLSNMTHEFRTPVNAILALTRLLSDRLGANPEERDELYYIRKSAQQLSDIVNDLLDIAKVEAGKVDLHSSAFEVGSLFSALRGMLRPLLATQALTLVFEEPVDVPPLFTDESKLSQILRNLISNALKYTERGEVRVSARLTDARDAVAFSVSDTGIGIPPSDLPRIFDEFVQIENPLQRRTKGTGLGLPLSKRLAGLLGGSLTVESTLGVGSTFTATIPLSLPQKSDFQLPGLDASRVPVLVIEDRDEDLLLFERLLVDSPYQPIAARTTGIAETVMNTLTPAAIIFDLNLYGVEAWDFLARLKRDARLSSVPVVVVSTTADPHKAFALGADACHGKPVGREWLLATLDALLRRAHPVRVLVVDDEETFRFIARGFLSTLPCEVFEADNGAQGLTLARSLAPDLTLLDFQLGDMTAAVFCEQLRRDPAGAQLPIAIVSSHPVPGEDGPLPGVVDVVAKSELTRERLEGLIAQTAAARRVAVPEKARE